MNDKISIIIPFYNSIKTIETCVKSVLAQTHHNFEAIFVNDGGTDPSYDLLMKYRSLDDRIVVINKEHSGVSQTRNRGIAEATGDYIQFLDSDDHIEPTMLERMLKASKAHNADVVVCNYTHPSIKNYLGDCVLNVKKKADLLKYCQTTFAMVVPWNKLYKKSVITDYYDKNVAFCEDDLFALTNLKNIKTVVSISDELYHYYVAPKETSIEESSCINAMAKAPDFWKTKNTYWYKRRQLLEQSLKELKTHLDDETAEDCAYARIFDFMIWELLIMDQIGSDRQGLIYEIQDIFREKEFKKSLDLRQKYGIKMKDFTDDELDFKVESFVKNCFTISEIANKDDSFKGFYACMYLFIKEFMEECGVIDSSDLIARGYNELINNSNKEAQYVNSL